MSARPILTGVQSDQKAWDANVQKNTQVFETAIPLPEYATSGALPDPAMYRGCVATVGDSTNGTPNAWLSDGTNWRAIGVPEYASVGALPSASLYRGRLASVVTGGVTADLYLSTGTAWRPVLLRGKRLHVNKTSAFTIDPSETDTFRCDCTGGAFTATLPSAATWAGWQFDLVKIDGANNLTIGGTLSGTLNTVVNTQWGHRLCWSDGTNWIALRG